MEFTIILVASLYVLVCLYLSFVQLKQMELFEEIDFVSFFNIIIWLICSPLIMPINLLVLGWIKLHEKNDY